MTKKIVYRVTFQSNNQIYEIYARGLVESDMFGFIEVEDILFGESSQVVIDPNDEKIKSEFFGVRRTFIPLHHILRIDLLEKEGIARIYSRNGKETNIRMLPTMGVVVPSKMDSGPFTEK